MVDISSGAEPDVVARRTLLGGRPSVRSPQEALQPDGAPQPPQPPKRKPRRPIISTASGILSFLGMAAIAVAIGWSLAVQRLKALGPLASDRVINLPHPGVSGIVDQLADEGVIENRMLMVGALWLEGERDNVKHGEYEFKQGASVQEVIDTLVSGKQILHAITIPEGLTSQQVLERLAADDLLDGSVAQAPREGSLMPDTYKFARGFDRDKLIKSMQAAQTKAINEVWAHRSPDLPIHSPYELATLASIVEKETGRADERPRVASVFINRLTRNMPLQSDPTVLYGALGGKGALNRAPSRSELDQKTPYNTYQVVGLPPGPIANPGRAALEAVANPSRTRDLYFVADGTGGHAFADNLDQHRQNVVRWRQIEKDRLDPGAPGGAPAGTAPARTDQRGDASRDPVIFGALGGLFDASGRAGVASLPMGSLAGTALPAQPQPSAVSDAANRDLNDLDIEVAGIRTKPDAGLGDGDGMAAGTDDGLAGTTATFPVPADRLAEQRAQARALGLPAQPVAMSSADDKPAVSNERFGKGKIFDASEGTKFDPLRDKSYDLNSAKTVPVLKALPPVPVLSYAK